MMWIFLILVFTNFERSSHASDLESRVLVVQNTAYRESIATADYYLKWRGIPQSHRCSISLKEDTEISLAAYESQVKVPIKNCLTAVGKENILYIVLTYRTPFRVVAPPHFPDPIRSMDSLLTDIFDESSSVFARVTNPYFAQAHTKENSYPTFETFSEFRKGGPLFYSVWRIDGPSQKIALGLVRKAILAEHAGVKGVGYFDRRFGKISSLPDSGYKQGDWDIYQSARFTEAAGFKVVEDDQNEEFGTAPAPLWCPEALFYSGWYSVGYNDVFKWRLGAIGFHLDSGSALDPRKNNNWAGGALLKGITITSGAVAEPYLNELVHPDTAFKYILEGQNVGDSFFRSTHSLKWVVQNIGDPLYRPF